MSTPLNIAVAYPSGDMVHADFTLALSSLCLANAHHQIRVVNAKSSIVAMARNNAVEAAQGIKADWLLFLDSDMVFPADTLDRLLKHDKDIIGAIYAKRQPPHELLGEPLFTPPMCDENGLVPMKLMPTGCLLIRMNVFARLQKPYFRFGVDEPTQSLIGEDYMFSMQAREAGFALWADLFLTRDIGHIGQTVCRATTP